MTARELYSRQETLHLNIPNAVTICGIGGIGSNAAIQLAQSGVPNLYLFDPDVFEEHNRNRIPVCQGSINRPKVDVIKEYINAIRPDCNVVAIAERLEGILLQIQISVSNCVLECTDSPKTQLAVYNACKKTGRTFVRAGYDGSHITVTSNISGWMKMDAPEEAYAIAPSHVSPAVIVAALAVWKIEHEPDLEVSCDISEIGITVLKKNSRLTARCRQPGTQAAGRRG